MLRIWRGSRDDVILYMHDHDALTFQYPEEREAEIIPYLLKNLRVEVPLEAGRTLVIPYDCKVGWNKADWSEKNPDGLKDYTPEDGRKRTPVLDLLDRKW
jgi:hypothetical protein